MMRLPNRQGVRHLRWVLSSSVMAAVVLHSAAAQAQERFVLHRLKVPLQNDFFTRSLMQNPDMSRIGLNVAVVLIAFLVMWMFRFLLQEFAEESILGGFFGATHRVGLTLSSFLTFHTVCHPVFHLVGAWSFIMLPLRPGLVLMY